MELPTNGNAMQQRSGKLNKTADAQVPKSKAQTRKTKTTSTKVKQRKKKNMEFANAAEQLKIKMADVSQSMDNLGNEMKQRKQHDSKKTKLAKKLESEIVKSVQQLGESITILHSNDQQQQKTIMKLKKKCQQHKKKI